VLPFAARAYVALTALLAVGAVALLLAVDEGPLVDRPAPVAAVAALIGLEHLFGTPLVRAGPQGETTTHEEAYIVALALLEPAPSVVAAVAVGFAIGVVTRRSAVKTVFNVSTMALAAAVAMLAVEASAEGLRGRGSRFSRSPSAPLSSRPSTGCRSPASSRSSGRAHSGATSRTTPPPASSARRERRDRSARWDRCGPI
jgi:hypothetical protein